LAPIEVLFGALVFVFALIGLARGFLRELGVTTIIMFLLFFLSRFEPYLTRGLSRVMAVTNRVDAASTTGLLKCWFFTAVIIGTAFISYQGETLAFGGQPPRGYQGIILGLLTGLLNGYLIVGSIWFYMDRYEYPMQWLGVQANELSGFAESMTSFLPISFLGQPILLGQSLLLYLSGLLLLARVIR
jgi:uncharacterized membrane protein required for colicin V production